MKPLIRAPRPPLSAPIDVKVEWLMKRYEEIVMASQEEGSTLADSFRIENPQPARRTLDASSATLAELREALCTFFADMRRRGPNRGAG